MSMIKGFIVQKMYRWRSGEVYIINSNFPDASSLCEMSQTLVQKEILHLNRIISGYFGGPYDWGVDTFCVSSYDSISHCSDDLNDEALPDVATSELRDFLIELFNFRVEYSDIALIKEIIGQAFEQIKSDPISFRRWPTDATTYYVTINNIRVDLVLISSEGDFDLTTNEYLDQVLIDSF